MKVAPLYHALSAEPWATPVIVHTGQHYDHNLSRIFFDAPEGAAAGAGAAAGSAAAELDFGLAQSLLDLRAQGRHALQA